MLIVTQKECYTKRRAAEQERKDLRERRHHKEAEIDKIRRGIDDKMKRCVSLVGSVHKDQEDETDHDRQSQLSDVERVRTEIAIAMNGSIGYVLDWLKDHAQELEHPIGLPPAISVNVTDPKYAWQVEQSLSYGQRCVSPDSPRGPCIRCCVLRLMR